MVRPAREAKNGTSEATYSFAPFQMALQAASISLHAAVGMPADVDGIDALAIRLAGEGDGHALLLQYMADAFRAQHQHALVAGAREYLGGDAGGREHLAILDRQTMRAQLRGLQRRWMRAAVGQHEVGNAALAQVREHFDGAGQHVRTTCGAIPSTSVRRDRT